MWRHAKRTVFALCCVGLMACADRPTAAAAQGAAEFEAAPEAVAKVESSMPVPHGGQELIGTQALPLAEDLRWINGEATTLEQLRGQVVLVRFWTDTCPFCEASAPGLTRLHQRYSDKGLVVLGLFHAKPRGTRMELDGIRARAKELGMEFPIASDERWDTLERWWLGAGEGGRDATSVSFLVDAKGVIRWIHPGPEFHPEGPADHEQCRADYDDAVRAIELLLAERAASGV